MISVVYVSSATHSFSQQDLMTLLEQCRDNNTRLDITGLLLYKDGNFMQVLEGDPEVVSRLYEIIEQDPRHNGILRLLKEEITDRKFPAWSMGFRDLGNVEIQQTPGYSLFLKESLVSSVFQTDPTRAQKLLLMFRERM